MIPNANAASLETSIPPPLALSFPRKGIGTTLSAILILESARPASGAVVVAVAGGASAPAPGLAGAGSAALAFVEPIITTDAHATAQQVLIPMMSSSSR